MGYGILAARNMRKPTVFIGSSNKGLPVARALSGALADCAAAKVWDSGDLGVFRLSHTLIESLVNSLPQFDFAILVLTADNATRTRGTSQQTPRDNVIFEIGLFMGALGRNRTFLVCDKSDRTALPSDLWGLKLAMFDGASADDLAVSIHPAAELIRREIESRVDRYEVDFLKAYLSIIRPKTPLSSTYSDIITNDYDRLRAAVRELERREDWEALLEVKSRLGEYFEYCGKYDDGVEFGELYARALEQLDNKEQAIWVRVKHLGYLLILAGKHELGREQISDALLRFDTLENPDSDSVRECKFYCYRYLGISWMRDSLIVDKHEALDRARKYFDAADQVVESFPALSRKHKELEARLLGNFGNLTLEQGQIEPALANYIRSLELFQQLEDSEHIGIAHLKVAESQIRGNKTDDNTEVSLDRAEALFLNLGWVEGQARVMEQRARLCRLKAFAATSPEEKIKYFKLSKRWASNSNVLYESIGLQQAAGRVNEFADEMERLSASAFPRIVGFDTPSQPESPKAD